MPNGSPALVDTLRRRLPEMVEALEALVCAESPSADLEACESCASVADGLARGIVGESAERVVVDGRTHLRWRFGAQPRVLVVGHLDTVWPLGTVARWPFAVRDDQASGPGAFDMKAGVVQLLFALALVGEGRGLDGVTVVLTTDEEIGSPSSRELLAGEARGARAVLIPEPSFDGALKTERKGVALYRLETVGRAAHAGLNPEQGINAAVEVARQVLDLGGLADPSSGTTVTPSLISAGTAANTVPASAVAHFDVRFATRAEGERIAAAFAAVRPGVPGSTTSVEQETFVPPLERSSSRELFELAKRLQDELGLPPLREASVGGGSDGNHLAALGVPTLDGLGAVGDFAHGEGEFVLVSAMAERAALLAALVSELLSA
ncbi:MAG TPA: M20 family metallopeptidase [Gaiellaceae bacterium]